jgi:hypothetical protein
MLVEHMLDMGEGYGQMWTRASRCMNCGHRDDAVIRQHRQAQAHAHAAPVLVATAAASTRTLDEEVWEEESLEQLAA